MSLSPRNAGRALILAAALSCAGVIASGCQASEPPAVVADTPAPSPADVPLEPLTIETARGPVAFKVEIADTDAERQRGLMFRTTLPPDRGMLFDFGSAAPRAFWMKNTYIPLDILYIDADGRVIWIAAMTEPFSEEPIPSHGKALGVLEIAGGRAAELGIDIGDRVRHRIFPQ